MKSEQGAIKGNNGGQREGADKPASGHIRTFTSNLMVPVFISQSDSLIGLFLCWLLCVYVVELSPFHMKKKKSPQCANH